MQKVGCNRQAEMLLSRSAISELAFRKHIAVVGGCHELKVDLKRAMCATALTRVTLFALLSGLVLLVAPVRALISARLIRVSER